MSRTRIIDISQFNTITDWDSIKKNVDAVIIRMGFRDSRNGYLCVDKRYVTNRKMCKALNIPYSLYFFTNAINEPEAIEEADFVAYECRDLSKFILPVFVDSEKVDGNGRADNLNKWTRTEILKAFCNRLQALGVPAGIYCNYSWSQNNVDRSKLPFSFWIAQWGVNKPSTDDYLIWQYTNSGTIPGISGRVDISKEKIVAPQKVDPVSKIIARANAEVGYLEKRNGDTKFIYSKTENAGSSNYNKYSKDMHTIQPSNMDYPAPWCDAFVDWCFYKEFGKNLAKKMLCGDFDDYTINSAGYYKNAGRWFTTPKVGDQVFFKNSLGTICHTGLVVGIEGNTLFTIEGNTSSAAGVVANGGCVRKKEYPITYGMIAGFGRPMYELAN